MKHLLKRVRLALEDGMRQQVTGIGFAFTIAIILVGLAAFASANNLIFLLFAALLATMLISGLISRLGLAGLELDLELPPQIAARRRVTGRVRIRNTKNWIPSFSIHLTGAPESGMATELYIPVLPGNISVEEPVDLVFANRGLVKGNSFFFSSRFPFGFTHRRAQVKLDREILVFPSLDPQPALGGLLSDIAGEIEARQRGRGSDFYRIRPYEFLESARHVDWKATAHTGDIQVREFAREQHQEVTILLDRQIAAGQEEFFEFAVESAAYLVWRLTQHDLRVRLVTQGFSYSCPDDGDYYAILKYLALVSPVQGKAIPSPDAFNDYQIAFSANHDAALHAGWLRARMLGPEQLTGSFTDQPAHS